MKKVSYASLISKTEKELEKEELELKVQTSKSNLEIQIATTNKDLADAKRRLLAAQSAYPYNVQEELTITEEISSLELGLDFAKKILSERF